MDDLLDINLYCPDTPERWHHRDVALDKRCKFCGLKRPALISSLSLRRRPSFDLDADLIKISSTEPTPPRAPQRTDTHLVKQKSSSVINTARRSAFTPKPESSYLATIYFKITLARSSPSGP